MRGIIQVSVLLMGLDFLIAGKKVPPPARRYRFEAHSLQWIFAAGLAASVAFTVPTRDKIA